MSYTILYRCPQCDKEVDTLFAFCPSCRFPMMTLDERYSFDKRIASGGYGVVYLGTDEHTGLKCAIKRIKADADEFDENLLAQVIKRFFREVEVTSKLAPLNEHIIKILAHGEDPQYGFFYVMEYLDGVPLDLYLKRRTQLNTREALHIFEQLCDGMQTAHEHGIIHRDLKPGNLFITEKRDNPHFVTIIDFGIAKRLKVADETKLTQGVLGTPQYLAPEQCTGGEITSRTDVYTMAVILFELLTGELPIIGATAMEMITAHIMKAPRTLSKVRPDLHFPKKLDEVIQKGLAKDQKDRYDSPKAFWEAITQVPELNELAPLTLRPQDLSITAALGHTLHIGPKDPLPTPDEDVKTPSPQADDFKNGSLSPRDSTPMQAGHAFAPTHDQLDAVDSLSLSQERSTPLPIPFRQSWFRHPVVAALVGALLCVGLLVAWQLRPQPQTTHKSHSLQGMMLPGDKNNTTPTTKRPDKQPPTATQVHPIKRPHNKAPSPPKQRTTRRPPPKRPKRKTRRRRRLKRRPHKSAKRAKKSANSAPFCGTPRRGQRWVVGRFVSPTEQDTVTSVSITGCSSCRVRKRRGRYCLSVPAKRSTRLRIRVKAKGFQVCRHKLSNTDTALQWRLKLTDPDTIANEYYPCHTHKP